MKSFDVTVIGGGPAGSATAQVLAQKGLSVLVIERSRYQEWRVGETLPPHARVTLLALGLMDRFLETNPIPSQAIQFSWGSEDLYESHFIFNAYGTGWHIDRRRFDAMLSQSAEEAGAMIWRDTKVVTTSHDQDMWQIICRNKEGTFSIKSSFGIDATGRGARLARAQGGTIIDYDRTIGLIGILSAPSSISNEPVMLLEAAADGWWYVVPLPNGCLLVTYMTDRDIFIASNNSPTNYWINRLAQTVHVAERVRGFHLNGEVHVRKANSCRLNKAAGLGWMAVGEAASAYDPLSGDGIVKALESGIHAAQAIVAYLSGNRCMHEDYTNRVADIFKNYLKQRSYYYRQEMRYPHSFFWRCRHFGGCKK